MGHPFFCRGGGGGHVGLFGEATCAHTNAQASKQADGRNERTTKREREREREKEKGLYSPYIYIQTSSYLCIYVSELECRAHANCLHHLSSRGRLDCPVAKALETPGHLSVCQQGTALLPWLADRPGAPNCTGDRTRQLIGTVGCKARILSVHGLGVCRVCVLPFLAHFTLGELRVSKPP